MGEVIVKPWRDQDVYVLWDTEYDRPFAYGTRAETMEYLGGDIQPGRCPRCRQHMPEDITPAVRLARADAVGSSARVGGFGWDDDTFIFEQEGYLRRGDLTRVVDLLFEGRRDGVTALLEPLDHDVV